MVETEEKFLDINYVETRIRELKEIRNKKYAYKIQKSNRENSKTIYVRFYEVLNFKGDDKFFGEVQLRISDHYLPDKFCVQFITRENTFLTKKRKTTFKRTLENCIKLCIKGSFNYNLNKISKESEKAVQSQIME